MNGRQIERELLNLKVKEKHNSLDGRMNIVTYEWGKVVQNVYYSIRFPSSKEIHLKDAKLELSDTIIQLNMLCLELGFNFDEIRELGLLRMNERYDDFKYNKWEKIEEYEKFLK